MAKPLPRDRVMTLDEYLAFEQASESRHEYVDGQVHAMTGVTRQHSRITMNVGARLWAAARGGPCRVHQGEVKLRVGNIIYYPDVMTACSAEPRDPHIEDAPSVIVEVLSPSTERIDRGEKAIVYRSAGSLETYVIIEQDRRRVDRHWRDAQRQWQREIIVETGNVPISSPTLTLTLDDIYEGVELPSPEEWLRQLRLREEAASYG